MASNTIAYGEGGRLKEAPDPLLINSAYKHDNSYAHYLMDSLHLVDLAYVSMLIKQNLIPFSDGKTLLQELKNITAVKTSDIINEQSGDIYNSKESYLNNKIGKISGWMHLGRPRREAINTAFYIATRQKLAILIESLIDLGRVFLNKAIQEVESVIPDYTYLYQATVTSFGHYLLTYYYPIERDLERLFSIYDRLNKCPLGSGISSGSNLNLDRLLVSQLLNFKEPIVHSRDGMWQSDLPIDILSSISICYANIGRLAQELQFFNSVEFSMIELPDSLCRTSVIMPQKKNPYPLTYLRGLSNMISGKLMASVSYGKVFSGNPDSRIFAYNDVPEVLDRSKEGIRLFARVVETVRLKKQNVQRNMSRGFVYASDLSEFLTVQHKIDYKSSHEIVGSIVRKLIDNEIQSVSANVIIDEVSIRTGVSIRLSQQEVDDLIDPQATLYKRTTSGSAEPHKVADMIQKAKETLLNFSSKLSDFRSHNDYNQLYNTVNKIIDNEP